MDDGQRSTLAMAQGGGSAAPRHANEEDWRMRTRNEALRAELQEMFRIDQELRTKWLEKGDDQELGSQVREVDQKNTTRMKEIINAHGWPGKTQVGEDGANTAWLLVQHADEDRPFQERCLALMAAAGAEEVSQSNLAYLVDRVRVGEGQPQVYGTQFWTDENGQFGPQPIEDEALVDERRASVGLGLLAEYRKTMMDLYQKDQPKQDSLAEQGEG